MGDGKLPASNRVLFSVRAIDNHYYFENICGMFKNILPLMEVHDAFPGKTGEEIINRCRLALSGVSYDESFTADLGHGQFFVLTLLYCENNTSFFSAVPINISQSNEQYKFPHVIQNMAYFYELCDLSQDGIIMWQVTPSHQFLLVYMNEAYTRQTGIVKSELGRTLEETYLMPKASYIRQFFEECVETNKNVSYISEYENCTLSVNLCPSFENGRVVRIMGTCRDITSHVNEKRQLENTNRELFMCDTMLRNQLKFEELISKTMRRFMDTGYKGFSTCIKNFVPEIGQLLDVSWAFILKNERVSYSESCEWFSYCGDEGHLSVLQTDYSALMDQLQNGRLIIINDLQKHKPGPLLTILEAALIKGLRSVIIVPILHDGILLGGIGVGQLHQKRIWTTMEISMLKAAAETIMSAYLRVRMEKQLNESNRVLVEYDESLQEMLAIQETIASVSQKYTITGINGFDTCTNDMLKSLCELFELDNAGLLVADDSGLTSTYEWCRKGIPQWFHREPSANTILPSWLYQLSDQDYIAINNSLDNNPQIAPSLIDTLLNFGIKSFFILPIRQGENIRGVMILNKVVGYHNWTNSQINTIKMFAEIFLGAYLRKLEEQQLAIANKTHLAFVRETVRQADIMLKIIRYSQAFVDATAENLFPLFANICKEIGETFKIESICMSRYVEDYTKTCHLFDWSASGRLGLCTDKSGEKNGSVCSVPLLYHKNIWGCMQYKCLREQQKDKAADILELFAQYFVHAYMRIFPNTKDCLTQCLAKTERKSLKLVPHPAII